MPELYTKEEPRKMTESKAVSFWEERVSIAKKEQETWAEDSGAKKFNKEYKGDYGIVFHARSKKIPIPPINEVFAYVQSDIASMYNRDPYISVNAKAGSARGAAFWEAILNYYWRELKTKDEIEYEIIDKDLVGYAFHKVGWNLSLTGTNEKLKVERDSLYSGYVDWKDVLWNIGSRRPPKDSRWMAQRIVRPLTEVKKRYPAARGLEGVPYPDVDGETYKKSSYKDDIKAAVLWEIWDAEEKKVLLLAEGLKERFLEPAKPWPDYLDEFPFLMYFDFIVPGSARPMSAIAPWEAQILEEMVLMGSAINHSKRWNRQAFVKTGTIDENSLDKYERGDDGAIILYNGDTADIKFADFGQLPTDFYLLMDRLQAIKRNINGQPEFARGGVTKTNTRTVGELQLMQQGTASRQERKIDRLETHLENIARHMMAHLKANFDFEQSVRITGDMPDHIIALLGSNYNPETSQIRFTPDDIQGEYDVDIKAGSTLPMDKQSKTQVMETILQTVAQSAAQGPMSNFMNTLIQELLKNYDIKSLQEAYQMDTEQAMQAKAGMEEQESIKDEKVRAEASKREAQAKQVEVETEMQSQEAMLGPMGRAQIERLKKEPFLQDQPNGATP